MRQVWCIGTKSVVWQRTPGLYLAMYAEIVRRTIERHGPVPEDDCHKKQVRVVFASHTLSLPCALLVGSDCRALSPASLLHSEAACCADSAAAPCFVRPCDPAAAAVDYQPCPP